MMGFDVKFLEAIDAMRYLNNNLYSEYHKELLESFAVSYKQLQCILDSLLGAIDTGQSLKAWEKVILANGVNLPKDLPETFFRTIKMACYSAGHWQSFVRNRDVFPYLMYDAINDPPRVRPSHLAMDGIIRPVGDIFWKTHSPPNEINCRCSLINLTETQAQRRSNGDNGLNKPISLETMKPDEGWDFNVGEDLLAFMKIGVLGLAKINAEYSAC